MPLKATLNVIGSMAGSTDDRGEILKKTEQIGSAAPTRRRLVV
jgi:hypothetical protein